MNQKKLKDKLYDIEKQEQELAQKKALLKKQLIEENNKTIALRKKITGEIMTPFFQKEFKIDLINLPEDKYENFLKLIKTEIAELHSTGRFQFEE